MHPRFIDRLARRIVVVKEKKGTSAAAAVVHRVIGEKPHEDYPKILERINYWRGNPAVKDTQ